MRPPVAELERGLRDTCEHGESDLEVDADGLVEALRDVDRAIDELSRSTAGVTKPLQAVLAAAARRQISSRRLRALELSLKTDD